MKKLFYEKFTVREIRLDKIRLDKFPWIKSLQQSLQKDFQEKPIPE